VRERPAFTSLFVDEFTLNVHLGCTKEERAVPQEVRLSAELRFERAPAAIHSDNLRETVCYADLCEGLRKLCAGREFQVIERLAYESYALVSELAGPGVAVSVSVHKVAPPVKGLKGGTRFRCGDFA
jgi:7,8-dihydroneopterin aldolase/epimerase/oxygenase